MGRFYRDDVTASGLFFFEKAEDLLMTMPAVDKNNAGSCIGDHRFSEFDDKRLRGTISHWAQLRRMWKVNKKRKRAL